MPPSESRIPEYPDQTDFLAIWETIHRGVAQVPDSFGVVHSVNIPNNLLRHVPPGQLPHPEMAHIPPGWTVFRDMVREVTMDMAAFGSSIREFTARVRASQQVLNTLTTELLPQHLQYGGVALPLNRGNGGLITGVTSLVRSDLAQASAQLSRIDMQASGLDRSLGRLYAAAARRAERKLALSALGTVDLLTDALSVLPAGHRALRTAYIGSRDDPVPLHARLMWVNMACRWCSAQVADNVKVPCGHMGMCAHCTYRWVEEARNSRKVLVCPFCREEVEDIVSDKCYQSNLPLLRLLTSLFQVRVRF